MINRDGQFKSIVCDSCKTETDPDENFRTLVDGAKLDGWEFKLKDGEWGHLCQSCCRKRNAALAANVNRDRKRNGAKGHAE